MSIFEKFFSRRRAENAPLSPWEQTIEDMRDQDLDCFDGVVEAVYSKDSTRRFVILQGADGRFRYEYQELRPYTQEEREFFAQAGRPADAFWTIDCTKSECPGWLTAEDARREMQNEKEYKEYF